MNKANTHRFISVIVCTHNGSTKIIDCLESLKNQSYPKSQYEVIIINDGSTDDTQEIISRYPYKIIHKANGGGLAAARNTGYLASKGEIVAFTDDDCIPAKNWIEKINENFDKDEIVGISGMVETYETRSIIQKYIEYTRPLKPLEIELSHSTNILFRLKLYLQRQSESLNQERWNQIQEISSVVGANMAFRKDILNKINGFDPQLTFGGEEEEICYRILHSTLSKKKLVYFPDLVVDHKFERSLQKSIKRNYMYGVGNARMKQKFPERGISLFPFPILIIGLSILNLSLLEDLTIFIFILPLLVYYEWILKAFRDKNASLFVYPYIQFLLESSNDLGWLNQFLFPGEQQ